MGYLATRPINQLTSFWRAFGHSYIQYAFGTADQTGRIDGQFSAAMDIERGANWQNYAVNGAALMSQGRSQGGFARILQTVKPNIGRGGPYAPDGGATLLCYGINDIGFLLPSTLARNAWKEVLRSMISRCRASTIFNDDFQVGTRTSYSAGFTNLSGAEDFASGGSVRVSTSGTTGHTITMTLPADYKGEPVAIAFIAEAGAGTGGTVTFSGTAGVTGTLTTTNIAPTGTHCHMIKRVTNLTSANAGQTIIATVTTAPSSTEFDGWWLEAKNAPPVILCNIARLTATGYTSNYPSWTGTEASRDADVQNYNADMASIVAEFDSMVQIADIDSVLTKGIDSTTGESLFFDGLHPNELGAAKCVDQMIAAYQRCSSTTALGKTANFNPPSPRSASIKQPRIAGRYYTWNQGPAPADVTSGAGTGLLWAFPFVITGGRERYDQIAMRTGGTAGTAGSFRWGLYDDPGWTGYPQCLFSEPTVGAAKSTGAAANTTITDTVAWPLDPGLYWIAFKWTVAPVTLTIKMAPAASDLWAIMPDLDSNAAHPATNPVACWEVSGLGTAVLPSTFPSGATLGLIAASGTPAKPAVSLRLASN